MKNVARSRGVSIASLLCLSIACSDTTSSVPIQRDGSFADDAGEASTDAAADSSVPEGAVEASNDAALPDGESPDVSTDAPTNVLNAHYVDCSQTDPQEDGTYEHPWNSVADVNAHAFDPGDDVYFAVNTTCTLPAGTELDVNWDGTSTDWVVVGAYHGDGLFGLNGNARPVLDGESDCLTTANCADQWKGAINANPPGESNYGYFAIADLEVRNTHAIGVQVGDYDHVHIQNVRTDNTGSQGVVFARGAHGIIRDNETSRHSRRTDRAGASIEITSVGGWDPPETHDVLVVGNRVHSGNSHEGIGVYTGAHDVTIEYNEVYDHGTYHIYKSDAYDVVIRYNLVYRTSGQSGGYAIVLGAECAQSHGVCLRGRGANQVYGNLVAGGFSAGIRVTNPEQSYPNCPVPCVETGTKIHNNTFVDTDRNISLVSQGAGAGNEVFNNLSFLVTAGTAHTAGDSPTGFSWSHNLWYGVDDVSGNAATGAQTGDPKLAKTTDWRSLEAGSVVGSEFAVEGSSGAIDVGMLSAGDNDRITSADFTATPIAVETRDDSPTPAIGAWTH